MFDTYYQQQLNYLRKRAVEFSHTHPAIAPFLAEASTDPDVERLLEGSAFLNGILAEKIDDDFPELIHGLTGIIFPHLLRPIPSSAIVVFTPKESLLECMKVPIGTTLASIPVDGTRCQFRTTMDIDIAPLKVSEVSSRKISGTEEVVTIKFQILGGNASQLNLSSLTFYIDGEFSEATSIFMKLRTSVKKINIRSNQSNHIQLSPSNLSAPGFSLKNSLFTNDGQAFRGYALLTEYFVFPEKFLFLELSGTTVIKEFGSAKSFEIDFILSDNKSHSVFKKEHFTLFATPVVNLFNHDADPVQVDHTSERLQVFPSGANKNHYSIYTVDTVTGFAQGMLDRRTYVPFNNFWNREQSQTGIFQVHRSNSMIDGTQNVHLSISYNSAEQLRKEILSVELTCSNNSLAENLRFGDISVSTTRSPELVTFKNITQPTPQINIKIGNNELWKLISHLSLNILPTADASSLQELLRMYTFENERKDFRVSANLKRINAIEEFKSEPYERIDRRTLMRGLKLSMKISDRHFTSQGDLNLFGSILDAFLSLYASLNSFTQLEITNSQSGEVLQWQPRTGEKPLI